MPRVRPQFKCIHRRHDRDGNALIVEEEPRYGNRKVYLHLACERSPRLLGEIDRQNRIMLVKRDMSKHLHHQMNSYGFNYTLLHDGLMFDSILLEESIGEEKLRYLIPVQVIREYSIVKNFKKTDGFEIQYFLRREYLMKFITKKRFKQNALVP